MAATCVAMFVSWLYSSRMKICVVFLTILATCFSAEGDDCKVGRYNLAPLSVERSPWIVEILNGSTLISYKISICSALNKPIEKECDNGVSVCRYTNATNAAAIGHFNPTLNITEDHQKGEFWLNLHGQKCPSNPELNMKTIINFKCGKTLGSPKFLDFYACETYFEWHSSVACLTQPTAKKEVRCYIYDKGKKRDLTPLIKTTGGYAVASASGKQFYINPCREITRDGPSHSCPENSSGCLVNNGLGFDMGQTTESLRLSTDGKLVLHYTSKGSKLQGCSAQSKTSITFVCPSRGGSKSPVLTSDLNCQYEVEWLTEYACPVDRLSSHTCILTSDQHGIDIDLTPLSKGKGSENPYRVAAPNSPEGYFYLMNVCGELGKPCPDDDHIEGITSCQFSSKESSMGHSLGKLDHQTLRYSDGELTLIYRGGEKCSNHYQRETVISFHCNKTADIGHPEYRTESNCTYTFDWETKYACVEKAGACQVTLGTKRYDLSALVLDKGDTWEALDGHHDHTKVDEARYFINVCHDVLKQGETSGCPAGAAACLKTHEGKTLSMGQYLEGPKIDGSTGAIKLHYKDGSSCTGGKKIESYVTFICRIGDLESGPTLIRKSLDGCLFEFEWHTAAACVLSRTTGDNCKVFDKDAGFNFDLSKLTRSGPAAFYTAHDPHGHDFFLNVCAPVTGTTCNSENHGNTGVCQIDTHDDKNVYNTGQPSSKLTYFDGMINLTYTGGDPYHSTPPVARQTEIAFLCDPKAGEGEPVYQDETNHTYSFHWHTKYACPEQPVECVVTNENTHEQFDLSSLSMSEEQENWSVIDDSNPKKKLKYYLNVCRPVNPVHVGTGCDSFAAACQTSIENGQESVEVESLGHTLSGPQIDSGGELVLRYLNGSNCTTNDGTETHFSATVHFRCKKGALATGPRFLKQIDTCEISFLWETEAACAIEDGKTKHEPCTVKDKNSQYIFNLQPLTKKTVEETYSITSGSTIYKLNVCGAACKIDDKESAVCEGSTKGDSLKAIAQVSSTLDFSDDGQLVLKYTGKRSDNGDLDEAHITFLCRRNVSLGQPKFVRVDKHGSGSVYIFDFETSLACRPEPVDCLVSDQLGNQYDLNPLSRKEANWQVVDSRDSHKDLTYFINVCRPINPTNHSCPGGPVGGCQVVGKGKAFSMGYIQGKPVAAADGSLTIRYMNGDLCHAGTENQAHRSTRINFFCAPTEHDPSFEGETAGCEYVFNWRTPSACPVKRTTGKSCTVKDPLYNFNFDLSVLRREGDEDYKVTAGEFTYLLNVCSHLNGGTGVCDGKKGVASCQTKPDSVINAGQANDELVYEDGVATLTYTNGKGNCHQKYNRTTVITFLCDQATAGTRGPKFINESSSCTYMFEWHTATMCTPFKIGDCSIKDENGNQFDLSTLTLTRDNYVYETQTAPRKKYVLNVCTTLVHTKGVTCPPNSAACVIDLDETDPKKKYKRIGEIGSKDLKLDNGHIVMTYDNGDLCAQGNTKSKTIITFQCDQQAIDSKPMYSHTVNNCEYYFIWLTKAVCPINTGGSEKAGYNCTATNPLTGYDFDLSQLKKDTGYSLDDHKGHQFLINICAAPKDSPCGATAGSCQLEVKGEKRHFNSGNFNAKLEYNDGILFLNYTGGEICRHNNLPRNTIINFVCGKKGTGVGKPMYVDESDDCTYYVSWHTELVCEKQVRCSVSNGDTTFDLSPLIKGSGHHIALTNLAAEKDPSASFYINICRPLNPIQGTLCPPEASACRVKYGEKPVSIGRVNQPPYIDPESKKVTILYDHGTPCSTNPNVNASSKIVFACVPGPSQGAPRLEDITSDCQYIFEWQTNVVCTEAAPEVATGCKFTDARTKHEFDLSPLRKNKTESRSYVVDKAGYGKYFINICAPVVEAKDACKGAAICHENSAGAETSMGAVSRSEFSMEGKVLKLTYSGGEACSSSSDGKASTQILFQCDRNIEGNGQPQFFMRTPCSVTFRWLTPLACPPATEECALTHHNAEYDLRLLSRDTSSWQLKDGDGNWYWMNICQGLHGGPGSSKCPSGAAICRRTPTGIIDNLGSVQTQSLTMDGDGKTIILKYSQGSNACAHSKRRSDNLAASTIIKLECGNTVGGPQFVPKPENAANCVFEFRWKTSIACKDERVAIKEIGGIITDPKSGSQINLNRLSEVKNHQASELRGKDKYVYLLNIDGKPKLDDGNSHSSACKGSAVCQTKPDDVNFYKVVGDWGLRKFFIEDDVVEAVFHSNTPCHGSMDSTAVSIIDFHCSNDADAAEPTFTYMSRQCHYLFDWYTPVVCVNPNVIIPQPVTTHPEVNASGASLGNKSKTIGTVVGIFSAVIIICILLIVFHRRDRREAFVQCLGRVKSRASGRNGKLPTFQYSRLANFEGDEEDGHSLLGGLDSDSDLEVEMERPVQPATATSAKKEKTSINNKPKSYGSRKNKKNETQKENSTSNTVRSYHDDSDDDILL